MRIAVLGATGLLGSEICRQQPQAVPLLRPQIDLSQPATISPALEAVKPDAVINCAGFTQVDLAESEPQLCYSINTEAVEHLAGACRRIDCALIQLSTDYVFGGDRERRTPYKETDDPQPLGVYANSKLAAERFAQSVPQHLIVRVCGLFGRSGKGTPRPNFVDTMLRLGRERGHVRVIDDQTQSPSYVPHLARAILFLIQHGAIGTYHVVNGGAVTWYDFAVEIFRQTDLTAQVDPISTDDWGAAAPRPAYSVLDTSKYRALNGPALPTWKEALSEYLQLK